MPHSNVKQIKGQHDILKNYNEGEIEHEKKNRHWDSTKGLTLAYASETWIHALKISYLRGIYGVNTVMSVMKVYMEGLLYIE